MDLATVTSRMAEHVAGKAPTGSTVKFDFGPTGAIYLDGKGAANQVSNATGDAECTISIALEDFVAMTQGQLDGTTAFMSGKLKVAGNMGIAMGLGNILR